MRVITQRLMNGDPYDSQVLAQLDAVASKALSRPFCMPEELKALELIRLARAQAAFVEKDAEGFPLRMSELAQAAIAGLSCSPYQSISWTILALGEYLVNGHTRRLDDLIDFSARTGPFEGWSLARRLDILLSLVPNLSPAQELLLDSQVEIILAADLHAAAVQIYLDQGDAQKAVLQRIFARASALDQRILGRIMRSRGADIDLPKDEPPGARPWER